MFPGPDEIVPTAGFVVPVGRLPPGSLGTFSLPLGSEVLSVKQLEECPLVPLVLSPVPRIMEADCQQSEVCESYQDE